MYYRAAGTRCAIDLSLYSVCPRIAVRTLESLGVKPTVVDLSAIARSCVGAKYKRNALLSDAPNAFDCSSFVKWLFAHRGIWVPRLSIQQIDHGEHVRLQDVRADDVVFTNGYRNWYRDDPEIGVGHVAFVTEERTVVHAACGTQGVVETPLDRFLSTRTFRGLRRFAKDSVITFEIPPSLVVEWSDDLLWLIRRHAI